MISNLLLLSVIPIIGFGMILITPSWNVKIIRIISLLTVLLTFLLSVLMYINFDALTPNFQYNYCIETSTLLGSKFNLVFNFGLDGLSLLLVLLTTFLTLICIIEGWRIPNNYNITSIANNNFKNYNLLFLALESILLFAFTTQDLFLFYLFFEAVLIPMFIMIGIFGSVPRRTRAAFKMFMYTLIGSLPMLVGIFIIYNQLGSTYWFVIVNNKFSSNMELFLWICLFISFCVKTPLVPLHSWLPETHSNAPTGGSIMLAGLLLKLGTYGIFRWLLPVFPMANIYFSPLVYIISIIGIIYVSLITLVQVDFKKVIAYSSIVHMSTCVIGLFSLNAQGISGAIILMIGHGIISPGLFLLLGILYNRHKTRIINYFTGLAQSMPLYSTFGLILSMANISLPILSPSFAGEFLIFAGIFKVSKLTCLLVCSTMVLSGAYVLLIFCRMNFGIIKTNQFKNYCDLNRREFAALLPIIVLCIIIGVFPTLILDICHSSVTNILFYY